MNRIIKIKIPEEIISIYDQDKHLLTDIDSFEPYITSKIREELEEGKVVYVIKDLRNIKANYPDNPFLNSNFMYEYFGYLDYALSEITRASGLKYRDTTIMYMALGQTQDVLNEYVDVNTETLGVLAGHRVRGLDKSLLKKKDIINYMCTVFAQIGIDENNPAANLNLSYNKYKEDKREKMLEKINTISRR